VETSLYQKFKDKINLKQFQDLCKQLNSHLVDDNGRHFYPDYFQGDSSWALNLW